MMSRQVITPLKTSMLSALLDGPAEKSMGAGFGDDVDDNKATYQHLATFTQKLKILNLNKLPYCFEGGAPKKGKQKMKATPTMLLKTNIEKSDALCHATMLLKTHNM